MLSETQQNWINAQQDRMISLVEKWSSMNSGTFHHSGVTAVVHAISKEFSKLPGQLEFRSLSPLKQINNAGEIEEVKLGPVLSIRCRPEAAKRVLLAIHTDTVYDKDSTFQSVTRDRTKLFGPGVADAKGGIGVMFLALESFEKFLPQHYSENLGWEVLLNPDEEIGSPCSTLLFEEAAQRNHIGLLYEPSLPDGSLVSQRKGSANFHVVCRGKAAHAGRHFTDGRNAIVAASEIALKIHSLNQKFPDATFNIARIDGGGPLNMVPAIAVLRFNIRYSNQKDESTILNCLDEFLQDVKTHRAVDVVRYGEFTTPPKLIEGSTDRLLQQVVKVGTDLGLNLNLKETGGVCDGNRLQKFGLPNVDTLGVRGGEIHSHNEYMLLDSLTERAKLSASLLTGWATDTIPWPLP